MADEKTYERVEVAEGIIKSLCEKYPEVFWRVRPERIAVLGITNKERSEKKKDYFKVNPVKGAHKALNIIYKVPISYIIELYWSDWNTWETNFREWMIFKALLMVSEDDGKLIRPDCKEFKIILDIVGVDWDKIRNVLPSLTSSVVPFKKELRPGMDDVEAENDGDNEEKEE